MTTTAKLIRKYDELADQVGAAMRALDAAGDVEAATLAAQSHQRLTRLVSYLQERAER